MPEAKCCFFHGYYPIISLIIVAIEKNPKATAVIAENNSANMFLYFS